MTKRKIVKVDSEVFSKITSRMMEAHRQHEMNATEAIGYVIAKEPKITVGMIEYVRMEMAEAFAPVDEWIGEN